MQTLNECSLDLQAISDDLARPAQMLVQIRSLDLINWFFLSLAFLLPSLIFLFMQKITWKMTHSTFLPDATTH